MDFAKSELDQAVGKMALIADERAASLAQADEDHGGRVVERDGQHAQRPDDSVLRQITAGERAGQRGHGQHVADQVASRVAHEQPRRGPVVPKKAHQRPHQTSSKPAVKSCG